MKQNYNDINNKRLKLLCNTSNSMYFEYNTIDDKCFFENCQNVLGYDKDYIVNLYKNKKFDYFESFVHSDDKKTIKKLQLENANENLQIEVKLLCSDGKYHNFEITQNTLKDENNNYFVMGCLSNIDNKYLAIQDIKSNLNIDEMTGVFNKTSTFSIINKILDDLIEDTICAYVFLDIDNFKQINDRYGHSFGDEVIKYVAQTLKKHTKDYEIVGRFGGDEFIVFFPNVVNKEDILNTVKNIMEDVKNFEHNLQEKISLTLSIGVSFENVNVKSHDMFEHADKALYTAKLLGKGQYAVYSEENIINPTDKNIVDLYEKKQFFKYVDEKLANGTKKYFLAAITIENYALFNKWYGTQNGYEYLNKLIEYLVSLESKYKGQFGYFGNNIMAILLPNSMDILKELEIGCKSIANTIGNTVVFLPAIGVYQMSDKTVIPSNLMYQKALEAQANVFNNFDKRTSLYTDEKASRLENEIMLILKFRKALANDQIHIFLQPKVNINTGKIVGSEMLMRWYDTDGKIIRPDEFIPVLEKYNIIHHADLYCWEKLFKILNEWQKENIFLSPISINVSRSDILSIDVAEFFKGLVEKYNINTNIIRIEITETVYTEANEILEIKKTINKLKEMGFLIFMDDFGSGYSSLSILKELNFDALKIDMRFLVPSLKNGKGLHILESVVKMAHDINLPVVVEGVETNEQVEYLKSINCTFAQGFLFYKPMPIEDYKNIILNQENVDANGIIGYWKKKHSKN